MAAQLRLKLENAAPFRREDYLVSPASAEALRLLDTWPQWRGGVLALVGPAGSGKTHLASAWAETVGARVVAADGSNTADLLELEGAPVLLEDADRAGIGELLFHLINMAARAGGSLLVTARTPPTSWPANLPDLRSRLNALPVALLAEPDDAVLTALLEKFFRERNIRPPEDLAPYLVRRIERSAVMAREIVIRLDVTADAQHRPISKALAREILEQDDDQPEPWD
ncbi:MAG TPA: chromosomal replication initiator DnaA [Caulobacteraceae bacterium]|nr:chromosomal replication initiator DnaA [Caulobacteraceae bacterium]